MSRVLTFDLGTSYFKTCLFDADEHLLASHRVPAPVRSDQPGRSEMEAIAVERCLVESCRAVARQAGGLRAVSAVSFASQANTFTLLDASDTPLCPLISWADTRASEQDEWVRDFAQAPGFYATTGVARLTPEFMVAKMRWLRAHEPGFVAKARRLCGLSDYLILWLTGNWLSEASFAGLTGLSDIQRLEYCPALLERAAIPADFMPPIVRAGTDLGTLRAKVADELGLPRQCRMVAGCLDQYAGAIGAGSVEPNDVCETTGTVLATLRCSDEFRQHTAAEIFQGPAFKPGLYYQMAFSTISAGLLELYRRQLPDRPPFEVLDQLAQQAPPGAGGLRLNRRAVTNEFLDEWFEGRTAQHTVGHEVRAILEGIAEELRQQLQALCGDQLPEKLFAAGGGARSQLLLDIKTRLLGIPVLAVNCPEPASLGAARLVRMHANGGAIREDAGGQR